MKLSAFTKDKAMVEFEFERLELGITEADGSKYAILYLKEPIAEVTGSQTISDSATGDTERVAAWDVDKVQIAERNFDADGIEINEDGTGIVKTNSLRLDVAKGSGDVWLTDVSFAQFGRLKRQENQQTRNGGMITRIQSRKTQATFKDKKVTENKPTPQSVASEATT